MIKKKKSEETQITSFWNESDIITEDWHSKDDNGILQNSLYPWNWQLRWIDKYLQSKKTPDPESFTCKLYQKFKEEIILILHTLLKNTEKQRMLPSSLYEASITQTPKADKK